MFKFEMSLQRQTVLRKKTQVEQVTTKSKNQKVDDAHVQFRFIEHEQLFFQLSIPELFVEHVAIGPPGTTEQYFEPMSMCTRHLHTQCTIWRRSAIQTTLTEKPMDKLHCTT